MLVKSSLSKAGFNVRGVVTDNHSSNVNPFFILQKVHPHFNGK